MRGPAELRESKRADSMIPILGREAQTTVKTSDGVKEEELLQLNVKRCKHRSSASDRFTFRGHIIIDLVVTSIILNTLELDLRSPIFSRDRKRAGYCLAGCL